MTSTRTGSVDTDRLPPQRAREEEVLGRVDVEAEDVADLDERRVRGRREPRVAGAGVAAERGVDDVAAGRAGGRSSRGRGDRGRGRRDGEPAASPAARTRASASGVTPGRSAGTMSSRSPVAASRASWSDGLRPRDRCSTGRAPPAAATPRTSGSGETTITSVTPGVASAAATVRRSSRSTRSRRSSASSTAPSRDFAPSNDRTGMATVVERTSTDGGATSGSGCCTGGC